MGDTGGFFSPGRLALPPFRMRYIAGQSVQSEVAGMVGLLLRQSSLLAPPRVHVRPPGHWAPVRFPTGEGPNADFWSRRA